MRRGRFAPALVAAASAAAASAAASAGARYRLRCGCDAVAVVAARGERRHLAGYCGAVAMWASRDAVRRAHQRFERAVAVGASILVDRHRYPLMRPDRRSALRRVARTRPARR